MLGALNATNTSIVTANTNLKSYVDSTYSNASNLTSGTLPNARLSSVPNSALASSTISGVSLGGTLSTLTMGVSGTGLSGSNTYNGSGVSTFTVTSNATNTNTAGAIVARDSSGNFSAGTITATLNGNASNITGTYGGTLTLSQVTSALGFTPYNNTNPNGYITSSASISGTASNITAYTINQSVGTGNSPTFVTPSFTTGCITTNYDAAGFAYRLVASGSGTSATIQWTNNAQNAQWTSLTGTNGALACSTAFNVTGDITATGNITAYYSDERLKNKLWNIDNALTKVKSLNGFYFEPNEIAQELGYKLKKEVGVSAQEVQAILPEIVVPAPVDDKYLTVHYEKLVPLLIEAIKELSAKVEALENK